MEKAFYIFIAIFFGFITLGGLYGIYRAIRQAILFKAGHNPYARICKKCGSHQNMYRSNIEGMESDVWWEEVYPIGNNPKCECHKYSQYRS